MTQTQHKMHPFIKQNKNELILSPQQRHSLPTGNPQNLNCLLEPSMWTPQMSEKHSSC